MTGRCFPAGSPVSAPPAPPSDPSAIAHFPAISDIVGGTP